MNERVVNQRIAARLLLASCTLAVGLGLGTAIAVVSVLGLRHPAIALHAPGRQAGTLDAGVHGIFLPVRDPAQPSVEAARPECSVTDTKTGAQAPAAEAGIGFASVRVPRSGPHQVACTSLKPILILVKHEAEGLGAYLAAIGRGLMPATILTILAAVLAAKALVAARVSGGLRSTR